MNKTGEMGCELNFSIGWLVVVIFSQLKKLTVIGVDAGFML